MSKPVCPICVLSPHLSYSAPALGHRAVTSKLIAAKANLEAKDSTYGQTPLMWAAENGQQYVLSLSLSQRVLDNSHWLQGGDQGVA